MRVKTFFYATHTHEFRENCQKTRTLFSWCSSDMLLTFHRYTKDFCKWNSKTSKFNSLNDFISIIFICYERGSFEWLHYEIFIFTQICILPNLFFSHSFFAYTRNVLLILNYFIFWCEWGSWFRWASNGFLFSLPFSLLLAWTASINFWLHEMHWILHKNRNLLKWSDKIGQ